MSHDELRWKDYFLREGEQFDAFWNLFLNDLKRDVLFVMGLGFDVRMCDGLDKILSLVEKVSVMLPSSNLTKGLIHLQTYTWSSEKRTWRALKS